MKKQFKKIQIAAESLSRSTKPSSKDFELETIEKQVEKYRNVLEKMVRKMPAVSSPTDAQEREKRIKKNSHYKIGQSLEESAKDLSSDTPLHDVLATCGELEKLHAECAVDSELQTETEVVRRLKRLLDTEITKISALKRNVTRLSQEYASHTRNYEAAIKLEEPQLKINQLKEQQENCESILDKERDLWAAQMFELIAKEDEIVDCVHDYVLIQRNYHERALAKVNHSLAHIEERIQSTEKSRFGTSLIEHLAPKDREISYILELCCCCLLEIGLYEEGLLRLSATPTKYRRMRQALESQCVKTPLPLDYQDPHVIGAILKGYLRELPEPLCTYRYHNDFIRAAGRPESERRVDIKAILGQLPAENYANLRYLTKFLWHLMQYSDYNKMSSGNLAICIAPNLLWSRNDKSQPADYNGKVSETQAVHCVVDLLISQWDYFFEGEVEFYVTLARDRLFVDGKSKSNSSSENLDRHEGDSLESPRYGTMRRQKACAPSPPAKLNDSATTPLLQQHQQNSVTSDDVAAAAAVLPSQKNGEVNHHQRPKELFPTAEKPEKPPMPKQLQQSITHSPMQEPPPTTPKPVPMTRTQFFGLDNLPSPTTDRKSTDSTGSLTLKPDLPQKPKIPKRPPMVLQGLNSPMVNTKSEDEITPTQANNMGDNGGVRCNTEKFLNKLRQENCDNVATTTATPITTTTTPATSKSATTTARENDQQQLLLLSDAGVNVNAVNSNANANSNSKSKLNSNSNSNFMASNADNNKTATVEKQVPSRISTPTTPISPNMIMTPKRPTVPAPPPPSIVKKQIN